MAYFKKREGDLKAQVVNTGHGNVEPVPSQRRFIIDHLPDYFLPRDFGMSNVSTKPCAPIFFTRQRKGKYLCIAPK